jgi:hypothetical protein
VLTKKKRLINFSFTLLFPLEKKIYAGPPEEHFIENVVKERIELGRLARELSQDAELLQVKSKIKFSYSREREIMGICQHRNAK